MGAAHTICAVGRQEICVIIRMQPFPFVIADVDCPPHWKGSLRMFGQTTKRVFLGLIVASFAIPIGLMLWNPLWGAIALIIGVPIATRCLLLVRSIQREGTLRDQQALFTKQNRATTIYVSLVDATGTALPSDIAAAKLAAAHATAGPRDIVIGVRHPLPPTEP
jgi:hypothetical protein